MEPDAQINTLLSGYFTKEKSHRKLLKCNWSMLVLQGKAESSESKWTRFAPDANHEKVH